MPRDSFEHLQITQTLGTCYAELGRLDEAMREHQAAQQALVAAKRERSVAMASAWVDLGDVELQREHATDAIGAYRRAVALYEELVPKTDARLAHPPSRLGEALFARGKAAEAIPPLERALAIHAAAGSPPNLVAEVAYPLARALWAANRDRARARALAEQALAALAGDPRVDEVATWLARTR